MAKPKLTMSTTTQPYLYRVSAVLISDIWAVKAPAQASVHSFRTSSLLSLKVKLTRQKLLQICGSKIVNKYMRTHYKPNRS